MSVIFLGSMMSSKKEAIIIDLDGTLCNCQHRLCFIDGTISKKDWKGFHEHSINDEANLWCKQLVLLLHQQGTIILFVSGRPETYRSLTQKWLSRHFDKCFSYHLFLRNNHDFRADFVVKEEIYLKHIQPHYEISFVIDDKPAVVEMWRKNNLVCLQC